MIVVCGFGRSGSTLLYNMIRATVTNYKTYDSELPYYKGDDDSITKRPLDILEDIPPWHKKIVMIRDIRAVITSVHSAYPGQYFASGDKYITGQPGIIPAWEAIKSTSGYWARYEHLVANPDFLQLRLKHEFGFEYNGLFSDFHKQAIPDGLKGPLNGVRPVDGGHDWRKHMDRVKDQFGKFPQLHDILIEAGYERDSSWLQ